MLTPGYDISQRTERTNSGTMWFQLPSFNGTLPAMVVLQDLEGHYFLSCNVCCCGHHGVRVRVLSVLHRTDGTNTDLCFVKILNNILLVFFCSDETYIKDNMGLQATETSLMVALMNLMAHMVLLQIDLCRNWCWKVG